MPDPGKKWLFSWWKRGSFCTISHVAFTLLTAALCSQYSWGFGFCKPTGGQHGLCVCWHSPCSAPDCFPGLAPGTHAFFGRSFTSFKCYYHLWTGTKLRWKLSGRMYAMWVTYSLFLKLYKTYLLPCRYMNKRMYACTYRFAYRVYIRFYIRFILKTPSPSLFFSVIVLSTHSYSKCSPPLIMLFCLDFCLHAPSLIFWFVLLAPRCAYPLRV